MADLITGLNSVTPLGLAAGLAYVIYLLVKNQRKVHRLETNHLHGLPEMAETLKRIEDKLQDVNNNIVYIRARVNGK